MSAERDFTPEIEPSGKIPRVWPIFVLALVAFIGVIAAQIAIAVTVLFTTKDPTVGFAKAAETLPQTMMQAPYYVASLIVSGLPLASTFFDNPVPNLAQNKNLVDGCITRFVHPFRFLRTRPGYQMVVLAEPASSTKIAMPEGCLRAQT